MHLILVLIKFSQHSYPEEAVMHVFWQRWLHKGVPTVSIVASYYCAALNFLNLAADKHCPYSYTVIKKS